MMLAAGKSAIWRSVIQKFYQNDTEQDKVNNLGSDCLTNIFNAIIMFLKTV